MCSHIGTHTHTFTCTDSLTGSHRSVKLWHQVKGPGHNFSLWMSMTEGTFRKNSVTNVIETSVIKFTKHNVTCHCHYIDYWSNNSPKAPGPVLKNRNSFPVSCSSQNTLWLTVHSQQPLRLGRELDSVSQLGKGSHWVYLQQMDCLTPILDFDHWHPLCIFILAQPKSQQASVVGSSWDLHNCSL